MFTFVNWRSWTWKFLMEKKQQFNWITPNCALVAKIPFREKKTCCNGKYENSWLMCQMHLWYLKHFIWSKPNIRIFFVFFCIQLFCCCCFSTLHCSITQNTVSHRILASKKKKTGNYACFINIWIAFWMKWIRSTWYSETLQVGRTYSAHIYTIQLYTYFSFDLESFSA